jgi:hypothetical protein
MVVVEEMCNARALHVQVLVFLTRLRMPVSAVEVGTGFSLTVTLEI